MQQESTKAYESNGYVFKIYSLEENRMHIHVLKAEKSAKYWLEPKYELSQNHGFSSKELSFIEQIIKEYGNEFKFKFQQHVGKRVDDK